MAEQKNALVVARDLVIGIRRDSYEKKNAQQENAAAGVDDEDRFQIEYGSFAIYPHDFVLVTGANGSGKSTFLHLFHPQSEGYFRRRAGTLCYRAFSEEDLLSCDNADELSRLNRMVAFVGQEENFWTGASAHSYIYDVCRLALKDFPDKKARLGRVDDLVKMYFEAYLKRSFKCEYEVFRKKKARSWSGGQKKMINILAGIIKVQVCGLKLILMDEPLNNLDRDNKAILNQLLKRLREEADFAILMVTHCQIFEGINKVLQIEILGDKLRRATLTERKVPSHPECLGGACEAAWECAERSVAAARSVPRG